MEEDIEALKIWIREVRTGGLCIVLHKNSEVLPVLENLIKGYKELEENLKIATAMLTKGTYPEQNEGDNDFNKQFIQTSKVIEKINEKIEYYNSYKGLEIYKKDNFKEIVITLEQLKQQLLQEGDEK